jgi:hypothetical protein
METELIRTARAWANEPNSVSFKHWSRSRPMHCASALSTGQQDTYRIPNPAHGQNVNPGLARSTATYPPPGALMHGEPANRVVGPMRRIVTVDSVRQRKGRR